MFPSKEIDYKDKIIELNQRRWLRASTAGMFIPEINNGSQFNKGQVLGAVQIPMVIIVKK